MEETKRCNTCGEHLSLSQFHKRSDTRDGRQFKCKSCNSVSAVDWQRENSDKYKEYWESRDKKKRDRYSEEWFKYKAGRYKCSVDELKSMVDESGEVCAICGEFTTVYLAIDHCHETGKIRGLLCTRCNTGLGLFKEDTDRLKSAILYLETHSEADGG